MAAMSNNNDSRVFTIDVESTGRDTNNSPLVNVYCEELGAVKFSMALYKLPEEDWKLMEAGTSCRVRLERGRPKTIGVENKDLDYYWEWRGFVTGGPERPIEAVGPPVTNTAANAVAKSRFPTVDLRIVRQSSMNRATDMAIGGVIKLEELEAWAHKIEKWVMRTAPVDEDELTPADLSDDGEISGLDEVHDDDQEA
jgi:hypothetical protein